MENQENETLRLINDIRETMDDWFAFKLTNNQIKEYLKEHKIYSFDTLERDDYVDYLSKKITGMYFPLNGDTDEYKKSFFQKMKENASKMGYVWNYS